MSADDRQKWNQKYKSKLRNSSATFPEPNRRLKEWCDIISGSHALDLACGLGGNALYLAQKGFIVDAVDIADEAVHYLHKKATQHNLCINAYQMDLDETIHLPRRYDLIIHTYYLDRRLIPVMKEFTAPQGLIFMETFFKGETDRNPHMKDAFKLGAGELTHLFRDWQEIYYEEDDSRGIASILCKKEAPGA